MKVYPCINKSSLQSMDLTYEQILKEEGIYKSTCWKGHVVVLRDRYEGSEVAAFYVTPDGSALEACCGIKTATFRKVDRQLCFEIR
jgi:hypothetical protein